MRSVWNRGGTGSAAASAPTEARWKRRMAAGLTASLAAGGLAAVSAQAANAAGPPPGRGISPAVVAGSSGAPNVFYTAGGGTVWTFVPGGTLTKVSNGRVLGAVSGLYNGSIVLFAEGTNHELWYARRSRSTWSTWASLGGQITAQPAAVYRGPSSADYSVFARGADGAVWARDHSSSGWGGWHKVGGKLFAGTGPSAAYFGGTYLLVAGANKELYLAHEGVSGFKPVGGLTTTTPALTTVPGALAGFARGTVGPAYYHRFGSGSPGWHPVGGAFTTGLGAANETTGGSTTYTVGLGADFQVYLATGHWAADPPAFSPWVKLTS
jgi:hypothetical protein